MAKRKYSQATKKAQAHILQQQATNWSRMERKIQKSCSKLGKDCQRGTAQSVARDIKNLLMLFGECSILVNDWKRNL